MSGSVSMVDGHIDPDKRKAKKYTEIFKLKDLLETAHIPFEFAERSGTGRLAAGILFLADAGEAGLCGTVLCNLSEKNV